MSFIRSEVEWLKNHAEQDSAGSWWCKKTGKPIMRAEVGRSIHWPSLGSGSGEVRMVNHLACEGCEPDKMAPEYGAPISEDQLAESLLSEKSNRVECRRNTGRYVLLSAEPVLLHIYATAPGKTFCGKPVGETASGWFQTKCSIDSPHFPFGPICPDCREVVS